MVEFLVSCAVLRVRLRLAMSGRMGACSLLLAWDNLLACALDYLGASGRSRD